MENKAEDNLPQPVPTGSRIAVVGCGLIGQAWAMVFLRAGMNVALFDPIDGVASSAVGRIARDLGSLEASELLNGHSASECASRITAVATLAEAVDNAIYVQESGPENLEIKRELTQAIDTLAALDVPIGSSTSGLPASDYARNVQGRHRCLVVHPINPPHLIPLVEVVPSPWTSPDVTQAVTSFLHQTNQVPISLNKEVEGFVVNRLQGALLHEAFRLLERGIASPRDIDSAISHGLGIRWSLMGPFETIHLNAPKGVGDYIDRFGPMYSNMFADEAARRLPDWTSVAEAGLIDQMQEVHDVASIPEAQNKRDLAIMTLLAHRKSLD